MEFDGVSWRLIPVSNGSIVRSLAWDSLGLMYVGAQGEMGFLAPDSIGNLRYRSLLSKVKEADRTFTDVWTTVSTPVGVFFGSYTHMFRWDGRRMHAWKSRTRFRQASWVNQRLYVQEEGTGLLRLTGDSLVLVPDGHKLATSKVYAILQMDSLVLIGTRERGLFAFSGQRIDPFPTEADDFLFRNELYCGASADHETVALGTKRGGIVLVRRDGRISSIMDKGSGLANEIVWGLFIDGRGWLWTALNMGICRVNWRGPLSVFDERRG